MKHYSASKYRARTSIGYLIKRAHGLMMDRIEAAFAEHGFTFMQWVVLMYARDELGFTATDICRDYRHDSGALTRLIDQLEARELIQRRRSTEDRRVVQLHLTDKGRETVESLIPLVADQLNWALEEFSVAEVAELTRLLGKLLGRLQTSAGT
ncbi:MAG: MarR family winged helix-turn-helix transcriptional regulator [Stenotrophobium sp.]